MIVRKPLVKCQKSSVFKSAAFYLQKKMAVIRSVVKNVDCNIDAKINVMYKDSTVPSAIQCETLLPVGCLLKF